MEAGGRGQKRGAERRAGATAAVRREPAPRVPASAAPPAGEPQRPLPAAPAPEPGIPAGARAAAAPLLVAEGVCVWGGPAGQPASQRRPEPPPHLHTRSLPRGRLPQRPPAHPSCSSSLRGDKAGMAMRDTEELWEVPTPDSVINFHQAAATTAPGIPRWASACKGSREV